MAISPSCQGCCVTVFRPVPILQWCVDFVAGVQVTEVLNVVQVAVGGPCLVIKITSLFVGQAQADIAAS